MAWIINEKNCGIQAEVGVLSVNLMPCIFEERYEDREGVKLIFSDGFSTTLDTKDYKWGDWHYREAAEKLILEAKEMRDWQRESGTM